MIYVLELDHRLVELDSPLFLFRHPKERGCMNCWWLSTPRGLLWTIKGHQWTIVLLELCILCICNITCRHSTSFHADWAKSFLACLFEPFEPQSPGTVAGCGSFTSHELKLVYIPISCWGRSTWGPMAMDALSGARKKGATEDGEFSKNQNKTSAPIHRDCVLYSLQGERRTFFRSSETTQWLSGNLLTYVK